MRSGARAIVGVAVILAGRARVRGYRPGHAVHAYPLTAFTGLFPGGLIALRGLLRFLVLLVRFVMTDRATAGCAHRSMLACHMARHAAYCRTFQTSFGIDGTRGEKHRGSGGECDEFSIHETGSFCSRRARPLACADKGRASPIPVNLLAVFMDVCADIRTSRPRGNHVFRTRKKARSAVATERAF